MNPRFALAVILCAMEAFTKSEVGFADFGGTLFFDEPQRGTASEQREVA
jgi:hypothetical protein